MHAMRAVKISEKPQMVRKKSEVEQEHKYKTARQMAKLYALSFSKHFFSII